MTQLSFAFFFNDTATTEIYTLSLHDALPICRAAGARDEGRHHRASLCGHRDGPVDLRRRRSPANRRPLQDAHRSGRAGARRSEEHTSELQSRQYLVCRLLLEKKKKKKLTTLT